MGTADDAQQTVRGRVSRSPSGRPASETVVLDHFTIEKELGRGGMGTVYLAHDDSLDRYVALKMVMPELANEKGLEERFVREARAQARLNHPNVVHIYFIGRKPPTHDRFPSALYFAMELVDGESLEATLERSETLQPERARLLMIDVAKGLREAHRAEIIHRDIKPSNLLLDKNGTVKIADFGIAKPISEGDSSITADGAMVGSPLYMAPEQARSDDVDHRADMYSLGACFYHLLCGKPVFDGQTPLSVVAKHLTSTVEPLRERAPRVPRALAIVIERLLAKDPAERFDTYDALIAALEAAAPDRAPYAGFWTRSAAVVLDSGLAGGLIALIGWPGLVVHLAHVTLGHAYRGQTLAKYFLRIQVRRLDGSRLGLPRSFVRTLASLWLELVVGVMILLTEGRGELVATIEQLQPAQVTHVQNLIVAIAISNGVLSLLYAAGLVLAAFHPQKRALHDLLVGSVVTYRLGRA